MLTNAVICEYNPFHNGHKYQLEKIKEQSDNPITAIMSGSFTQRGDISIANKFIRAETAVKTGVDLVIELPTVYACSSARNFAYAGVETAKALGCTENLCFSTEEGNAELLIKAAELFDDENFNAEIKRAMESGQYYPQAVENAYKKTAPALSDIVTKPNNILALEYLKALKTTSIKPMIIKRTGAPHDSKEISDNFTSAGNIREMILNGKAYDKYIPNNSSEYKNPAYIGNLEKAIIYKLRTMSKEDYYKLPDVSEGLHNRIYNSVHNFNSLEEIIADIKTKRYTHARIRRIIISALLNITKEDAKIPVPYLRVLAFNERGAELLGTIKKSGTLPIITNVADGYKKLNDKAKRIFNIDLLSSDIYYLATDEIKPCGEDFTNHVKPIKEQK